MRLWGQLPGKQSYNKYRDRTQPDLSIRKIRCFFVGNQSFCIVQIGFTMMNIMSISECIRRASCQLFLITQPIPYITVPLNVPHKQRKNFPEDVQHCNVAIAKVRQKLPFGPITWLSKLRIPVHPESPNTGIFGILISLQAKSFTLSLQISRYKYVVHMGSQTSAWFRSNDYRMDHGLFFFRCCDHETPGVPSIVIVIWLAMCSHCECFYYCVRRVVIVFFFTLYLANADQQTAP